MLNRMRQRWSAITQRQRKICIITGAFVIGLLGITGGIFKYIDQTYRNAAKAASMEYSSLLDQFQENNTDVALMRRAEHLVNQYPKTIYADMTRLMLAKGAYQEKHTVAAKAYLEAVLKNKKSSDLVHIARVRLARLLAEEQQYQQALSLLNESQTEGFEALYQSAKGDIYLAMQSLDKANEAYLSAIKALPEGASDRWLQMKQADIGGKG